MLGHPGVPPLVAGLCGVSACCPPYDVLLMSAIVDLAFSVATEISLVRPRGARAMMPAMARPTPFVVVPLIIAMQMITRSRPRQE